MCTVSRRGKYLWLPLARPAPGPRADAAGGLLYDTPGLHLHHRMPHLLSPEEKKRVIVETAKMRPDAA